MSILIAEYFGQRTDVMSPAIQPKTGLSNDKICPFMNKECEKIRKRLKPVCCVRKSNDNTVWIVCRHRLCSTDKKVALTNYQKETLLSIAREVFSQKIQKEHILIKREANIPVVGKSNYHADYIMSIQNCDQIYNGPKEIVLEIQGGGETSNTGLITTHINNWEKLDNRTNGFLSQEVKNAATIETNAWRRQQEQFIIKGNIAFQTGGAIVFCVGSLLYDYLWQRLSGSKLNDLRNHNWTVCLLCFEENRSGKPIPGAIPLQINKNKILFTNYSTFMNTLTNQGEPYPEMFAGTFETLDGLEREVPLKKES